MRERPRDAPSKRRGLMAPGSPPFDVGIEDPDLMATDHRRRHRATSHAGRGSAPARSTPPDRRIDPRIAARRARVAAVESDAASRRRHRLAKATIALVMVVGTGGLVLLSPLVSVRTIEVRGAERTTAAAVRAASGLGATLAWPPPHPAVTLTASSESNDRVRTDIPFRQAVPNICSTALPARQRRDIPDDRGTGPPSAAGP